LSHTLRDIATSAARWRCEHLRWRVFR